jgi:hypothetical protein
MEIIEQLHIKMEIIEQLNEFKNKYNKNTSVYIPVKYCSSAVENELKELQNILKMPLFYDKNDASVYLIVFYVNYLYIQNYEHLSKYKIVLKQVKKETIKLINAYSSYFQKLITSLNYTKVKYNIIDSKQYIFQYTNNLIIDEE